MCWVRGCLRPNAADQTHANSHANSRQHRAAAAPTVSTADSENGHLVVGEPFRQLPSVCVANKQPSALPEARRSRCMGCHATADTSLPWPCQEDSSRLVWRTSHTLTVRSRLQEASQVPLRFQHT